VLRGALPTWPLGRWVRWLVAGGWWPRRYRGCLLCLSSVVPVPAAAGRGMRPRVFSAHRPLPQLQVHAPTRVVTPHSLAKRLQTGKGFLHMPIFTIWPGLVPIQTGAPAQIRAADRSSGTPAVLPSTYVASVDHTTRLLRRSARCSVITQRARMQQRPSSATDMDGMEVMLRLGLNAIGKFTKGLETMARGLFEDDTIQVFTKECERGAAPPACWPRKWCRRRPPPRPPAVLPRPLVAAQFSES
jgi:hypothetical protein